MRLRIQLSADVKPGGENRVNPKTLNHLDRHILKQSLRQAASLRQRLELDYHSR